MTTALLDELRRLEAELHHPGSVGDAARLDALLHPDFFEVGKSGAAYTRAQVLGYLAQQTSVAPVQPAAHAVAVLAPDCALLTYRSHHPATADAAAMEVLRSSIWRQTAQGWQLFYHQGTPVPPEA